MMRRRNNINYRSDAYKDYKEFLRRSNPLAHRDEELRGGQGIVPSPHIGSAPGNSYPSQNEASQSKKHALEKRNKKVEFAQAEKLIEIEHNVGSSEQVYEVKSIDMEASDFIKRKHKLFEMARLTSLRGVY